MISQNDTVTENSTESVTNNETVDDTETYDTLRLRNCYLRKQMVCWQNCRHGSGR